ncbi:nucleotidyltransferase family protein [Herpetosiphon sp. NSE202]|uniref:nucleotidyltransferase domain-containing protein n=1 Tax=Herpetosiphon sp. NSE202 TaxID=3351349 RepID=UPI003631297F
MGQPARINQAMSQPALALLLAAWSSQPQPNLAKLCAACGPNDWQTLGRLANYHEVEGLLWFGLRQQALPPALAEHWRERYYLAALRNDLRLEEFQRIQQLLKAESIEVALLKGMAFAPTIYRSLGQRQMGDIDLLIRRDELQRACAVLFAAGYGLSEYTINTWPQQRRSGGEVRLQTASGATLELHWWLFAGHWSRWAGLHAYPAWQIQHAEYQALALPVLEPISQLLHTAHHLVIGNQFGAGIGRMLTDIDRLIATYDFDWQQVWHEAQHWRLAHVLWGVLRLAEQWFNSAIEWHWQPQTWRKLALETLLPSQKLLGGADPRLRAWWRYAILASAWG